MKFLAEIIAPSRLHFGLYGFGAPAGRQFGGVGAMIDSPHTCLQAWEAEAFLTRGPLADRVATFAERWLEFHQPLKLPRCELRVTQAPPEHTGLGVGTQLGLSVAALLNALSGLPSATPLELAASVGRGLRSAVGTYGFMQGGFIAERGKLPHEPLAPLDVRLALPAAWRFLLVRPIVGDGLHGSQESQAFARVPAVADAITEGLIALVRERLLPAATSADFDLFSRTLTRYCREAGECFASIQGGAYNGKLLTELVAHLESLGATGVGQSSWGPTLFCVLPNQSTAESFRERLLATTPHVQLDVQIARPQNTGATVRILPAAHSS